MHRLLLSALLIATSVFGKAYKEGFERVDEMVYTVTIIKGKAVKKRTFENLALQKSSVVCKASKFKYFVILSQNFRRGNEKYKNNFLDTKIRCTNRKQGGKMYASNAKYSDDA